MLRRALPFVFLIAIAFAHIAPALFTGRVYANLDYGAEAIPAAATLRGKIPFAGAPPWNPYVFGGAPAEILPTMARYPLNLGAYLLPAETAVPLFVALHLALGAIAAFFFVRRVAAVGDLAAVFGASVFAFGGAMWIRGMHVQNLAVWAWMPAILLAAWEVCAATDPRVRCRAAALLALVTGLALLVGGGFQPLLYCAIAGVLVMFDGLAFRTTTSTTTGKLRAAREALPWLAAAAAIALFIGLPGMLPTLEVIGGAARGGLSLGQTGAFSLTPPSFARLLVPELLLGPDPWTEPDYLERWVYFGLLSLPLAAAGARDVRGRGMLLWTIGALVLALGLFGPLHYLAYFIVPGYDQFRAAGRWVVPAGLVFGCLAARGLDALAGEPRARTIAGTATALLAVAVVLCFAGVDRGAASAETATPFDVTVDIGLLRFAVHATLAVLWMVTALLIASKSAPLLPTVLRLAPVVLALDVLALAWEAPRMEPPKALAAPPVFAKAASGAIAERLFHDDAAGPRPLNNGVRWGYRNARGYSQAIPRDLAGLLDAAGHIGLQAGEDAGTGPRHTGMPDYVSPQLLRLLGAGIYVTEDLTVGPAWVSSDAMARDGGLAAWRTLEEPFAGALVTATVVEPDAERRWHRSLEIDPFAVAVVESDLGFPAPGVAEEDPTRVRGTVRIKRSDDGMVIDAALGAQRESLFVLAESWHPRWRATLDGAPVPIVKADGIWQAVRVPAGDHDVRFTCRAAVAWWMWAGMLAGLALAGALRWARIGGR